MKKINKILIITTTLILTLVIFYKINELNYRKHIEIKRNYINHPEDLPTKESARMSSF
jgi:hypothetical protein